MFYTDSRVYCITLIVQIIILLWVRSPPFFFSFFGNLFPFFVLHFHLVHKSNRLGNGTLTTLVFSLENEEGLTQCCQIWGNYPIVGEILTMAGEFVGEILQKIKSFREDFESYNTEAQSQPKHLSKQCNFTGIKHGSKIE